MSLGAPAEVSGGDSEVKLSSIAGPQGFEDDEQSALTHDFGDYSEGYDHGEEKNEEELQLIPNPDWEEFYDDESQSPYWYNSSTQETTWEEPPWTPQQVPDNAPSNYFDEETNQEGSEASEDYTGVKQALACFQVPELVPKRWTDFGQSILFHGIENPSPFLRINVFEADDPPRDSFRLNGAPKVSLGIPRCFHPSSRPQPVGVGVLVWGWCRHAPRKLSWAGPLMLTAILKN